MKKFQCNVSYLNSVEYISISCPLFIEFITESVLDGNYALYMNFCEIVIFETFETQLIDL